MGRMGHQLILIITLLVIKFVENAYVIFKIVMDHSTVQKKKIVVDHIEYIGFALVELHRSVCEVSCGMMLSDLRWLVISSDLKIMQEIVMDRAGISVLSW